MEPCDPPSHTRLHHLRDGVVHVAHRNGGVVHVAHRNGGAWCCIDWRDYSDTWWHETPQPVTCFWCLVGVLGVSR